MSIKRLIFDSVVKSIDVFAGMAGKKMKNRILAELVGSLTPIQTQSTPHGGINFYCLGKLPQWRAETLLTKEPDTIQWIDSFEESSEFWDIGANIGVYSLYAANRKIKVTAFEPSASNYYILTKNIEINGFDDQILAYCLALSNHTRLGSLNMVDTQLGSALHDFGEKQEQIDIVGTISKVSFQQGVLGYSIDDLIEGFSLKFPNYIKIDVDGIEDKIIKGAEKTLKDSRLKSVLIELDTRDKEYCGRVISVMDKAGIQLVKKVTPNISSQSDFYPICNHIFSRV